MSYTVYIRPLVVEDANVSYEWRNNPFIWRFTGSKPDKLITPEIEAAWLENALNRTDEKRFAICMAEDDKYIGNIFLTNITEKDAYLHTFIGEVKFWGSGRAIQAAHQLCKYGFTTLKLDNVFTDISLRNAGSLAAAKGAKFEPLHEFTDEKTGTTYMKLVHTKERFEKLFWDGFDD